MAWNDVEKALIVSSGEEIETFSKIYGSSNENLKKLFQCFSVNNKDVLTVLASSDQFFHTVYHGARSVDTFDINPLTKYYYYLRRWLLLYNNEFYPSKRMFQTSSYLNNLLQKVKPEDKEEENAYQFWKNYLKKASPKIHENLYCLPLYNKNNLIFNQKELKEKLVKIKPSFYHQDLFGEITCPKKYDIVITSNILEYGTNTMKLSKASKNLKLLLREGGKVIASHFVLSAESNYFIREKNIFLPDFEFQEFVLKKNIFEEDFPLGYSYQKRHL